MGSRVHGLSSHSSWALEHRLSRCGAWAQLLGSVWDTPGPGIEAVSPVLEGGFFTTEPPGKPERCLNCGYCWLSFAKKLSASVLGPFICEDLIGFIV